MIMCKLCGEEIQKGELAWMDEHMVHRECLDEEIERMKE